MATNGTCIIHDTRITVSADEPLPAWANGRVTITAEHPAASYGLPVIVIDGQPYGPADLPEYVEVRSVIADHDTPPTFDFMTAFNPGSEYYEYTAKCMREDRELWESAQAAGYRVG